MVLLIFYKLSLSLKVSSTSWIKHQMRSVLHVGHRRSVGFIFVTDLKKKLGVGEGNVIQLMKKVMLQTKYILK